MRRCGSPGRAAEAGSGRRGRCGKRPLWFFNSALNLLNYTTYFEMKTRAGTIGKNGVAPFLDRLPPSIEAFI